MSSETIGMMEILDLCHIPYGDRTNFYIDCPVCGKKGKFNINLQKEVFRCARCDISGGYIHLYGLMKHGISPSQTHIDGDLRKELYKEIVSEIKGEDYFSPYKIKKREQIREELQKKESRKEKPLLERHLVYRAFLAGLSLNDGHKKDLLRRGLSEDAIERGFYRSTPYRKTGKLIQEMSRKGYDLIGIPGFYQSDDLITVTKNTSGYFIPVRDVHGWIQGLQIRSDEKDANPKYIWFSSSGKENGTGASSYSHFCGSIKRTVYLTEGPLKADIIHFLSGVSIAAVPGVNATNYLFLEMKKLREVGVENVRFCFDMDYKNNLHVKKALKKVMLEISKMGFQVEMLLWDEKYKGLDDFFKYLHDQGVSKEDLLNHVKIKKVRVDEL